MILLTIDVSPESESALDVAAELAKRFEQPLRLLLVLDGPLRHHFDEKARSSSSTIDDEAQAYLDSVLARARSLTDPVEGSFEFAVDAGEAIVEAAQSGDVALVVMATHGRSGFSRLLAGSVTDHVIRYSTVPVVAVPVREGGDSA